MNIKSVKYIKNLKGENTGLEAVLDNNEIYVPLNLANRHYAEFMRQVEAGKLTIEEAS